MTSVDPHQRLVILGGCQITNEAKQPMAGWLRAMQTPMHADWNQR